MMQYIFVLSVVLSICRAAPSFELLATFTDLKDSNATTESCVYDPMNDIWRFWDRWMDGETYYVKGTYPGRNTIYYDDSTFPSSKRTMRIGKGDAIDTDGGLGTVYVDGIVYIADAEDSVVIPYDVEDISDFNYGAKLASIPITNAVGLNGICHDPVMNRLYVTNPGINFDAGTTIDAKAGIWSIDINDTSNDVERVYDGSSDTIKDQNGDIATDATYSNGGNRVFHPNGCTVKDGIVYLVEIRPDLTGALGMFNIETGELSINTDALTAGCDGIGQFGDYLIASSWGSFDPSMVVGKLIYYNPDTMDSFMDGIDGLISPANFVINPYGVMCVPSLQTGDIYFIRISTDSSPSFTVLSRTFDMTGNLRAASDSDTVECASNSVAYDAKRDRFAFVNQLTADDQNEPDVNEISADWAADKTITDNGFVLTNSERETVVPIVADQGPYYLGQIIVDDILYIIDTYGRLYGLEMEEENVINYVDFGTYPNSFGHLSGVCVDPDDTSMIYVTGSGGILSVDVSNMTVGEWVVTPVYGGDASSKIQDQNGENTEWSGREFFDCTVYGGKIYLVQNEDDSSTRSLGIHDIAMGKTWYNENILSLGARSIISSANGILIVAQEGTGQVLSTTVPDDGSDMIPFQIIATDVALTINGNVGVIFGMTTDPVNGVIALAAFSFEDKGFLYFIQSDDLITDPKTTTTTEEPLMDMSSTVIEDETSAYSTADRNTEPDETVADKACFINIKYVIATIIFSAYAIN